MEENVSPEFIVVTSDQTNGELILFWLKKEFGATSVCLDRLPPMAPEQYKKPAEHVPVCLIDCMGLNADEIAQRIDAGGWKKCKCSGPAVVLFNVEPNLKLKTLVKRSRVLGVFTRSDSTELLLKGLKAVRSGRQQLSRHVLKGAGAWAPQDDPEFGNASVLSGRQKEILNLMAGGASNQDIAEELSISIHTVKTHIYQIYRKYHVSNRIQASLFANPVGCHQDAGQ